MCRHKSFAKYWRKAAMICLALLICLSAGCGRRVEYVNGDRRLTRLKEGQPAPRAGVLIGEGYLSEIYEAMGQPRPNLQEPAKAPGAASAVSNAAVPSEKENTSAPKK